MTRCEDDGGVQPMPLGLIRLGLLRRIRSAAGDLKINFSRTEFAKRFTLQSLCLTKKQHQFGTAIRTQLVRLSPNSTLSLSLCSKRFRRRASTLIKAKLCSTVRRISHSRTKISSPLKRWERLVQTAIPNNNCLACKYNEKFKKQSPCCNHQRPPAAKRHLLF